MHPFVRYLLNCTRLSIIAALINLFIKVSALSNIISYNYIEILFLVMICSNHLSIKNVHAQLPLLRQTSPTWLTVLITISLSAILAPINALVYNTCYMLLDLHIFSFAMTYKTMCYLLFALNIPTIVNVYFMQENITEDQE